MKSLFFWSKSDDESEDSKTDAGRYSSPQLSHLHQFSTSFFHLLAMGEQWEDLIVDNFHTGPVKKKKKKKSEYKKSCGNYIPMHLISGRFMGKFMGCLFYSG